MLTTTAPWTLHAWPPLLWQASRMKRLHFVHLDTRVRTASDPQWPSNGQTIWVGPLADGEAGMAWDWVLLSRGVVTLADPMSIVTNLRIIGRHGKVLTALESVVYLNTLVHDLPWQDHVCRILEN